MTHPLLIVDCDGVLVDSERLACTVLADEVARHGAVLTLENAFAHLVGRSSADTIAWIEMSTGIRLPSGFDVESETALLRRFPAELRPISGMADALRNLPLPRCVASSSSPERIALALRVTGLAPLFGNHVFSANQVRRGKPYPDLFLFAAERMGAASRDCIVIEDSVAGVTAGRAAGMWVIGFMGGSHCGPDHAERLLTAGAHCVVARAGELAGAIAGLPLTRSLTRLDLSPS